MMNFSTSEFGVILYFFTFVSLSGFNCFQWRSQDFSEGEAIVTTPF